MDLIVIGGGPAGMMAAVTAAQQGAQVHLLDHKPKLGRKLLITGKGRCNLCNTAELPEWLDGVPGNPRFLYGALHRFSPRDLMDFFASGGCPLKVERGNRVFPQSDRAQDVLAVLLSSLDELRINVRTGCRVVRLLSDETGVIGVQLHGKERLFGRVVLATGGMSYPATGSDGSGYRLARDLGHRLVDPLPSLVGLTISDAWPKTLSGLALRNVSLSCTTDPSAEGVFGEMLFTHTGISGPIVLRLSRTIVQRLHQGEQPRLSLDLKPALSEETLDERILRELESAGRKELRSVLKTLVPRSLVPVLADLASLDLHRRAHGITRAERQSLSRLLKEMPLHVDGHGGFSEAIATQGGVDVSQIDPRTMESRLVPGLFMAGEMLDLDGYTGGYNLQIAFSTGHVAGFSAAKRSLSS